MKKELQYLKNNGPISRPNINVPNKQLQHLINKGFVEYKDYRYQLTKLGEEQVEDIPDNVVFFGKQK